MNQKEIAQKLASKEWRMSHLYKITDKSGNLVTFRRNRAQEEFNEKKAKRNIILKSRQLGFTTEETIDTLDDVLSHKSFEALFLSYDIPSQTDIFDKKIMLAWENIPEWLKSQYILASARSNQLKVGFGDNTFSAVTVRTKGRSGTFQRLHISEYAKICNSEPNKAKEILSGTIQAVPLHGRVDIESTAEGDYGYFYDLFWEAWERGEPTNDVEFKAHFYNWTYDDHEIRSIVPIADLPKEFLDYQEQHNLSSREITYYYYKWLSLSRDWSLLRQEYPTTPEEAFISSGDKFFDVDAVARQRAEEGTEVGEWTYFEDYVPGHRYALGADVGEGIGRHGSAIVVIDFDSKVRTDMGDVVKPKVVATFWSNRVGADMLAHEIKNVGTRYGNCLAAVERNNHGHATLAVLNSMYHNIFIERKTGGVSDKEGSRLGWHTNKASKPKMLYDLKTAINEGLMAIPCKRLKRELSTYPREDLGQMSFKEDDQHHWDSVIALAIAWQMVEYAAPSFAHGAVPDEDEPFDKFSVVSSI